MKAANINVKLRLHLKQNFESHSAQNSTGVKICGGRDTERLGRAKGIAVKWNI